MFINQGLYFCTCQKPSIRTWYCYECQQLIRDPTQGIVIPVEDFPIFCKLFRPMVDEVIPRPATSDSSESQAMVDEITHKAFNRISSFAGTGSFQAWLQTLARNHYLDVLRRDIIRNRRNVPLDAETLEAIYQRRAGPDVLPDSDNALDWLESFLGEDDYQLLYLRYVEDYTIAQAAAAIGLTEGQGRYRIPVIKKTAKAVLELKRWLDSSPTDTDRRFRALELSMSPDLFGFLKGLYIDELTPKEIMNLYALTKKSFEDRHRKALDQAKAIDQKRNGPEPDSEADDPEADDP